VPENEITQEWTRIRVRSFLGVIIDEWIKGLPGQSVPLLDYHLENLLRSVEAIQRLKVHSKLVEGFGASTLDMEKELAESSQFPRPPVWRQKCDLTKFEISIYWLELNHMLNYVKAAVSSPEFFEKYVGRALNMSRSL